jgi:hypothetical protein
LIIVKINTEILKIHCNNARYIVEFFISI